MSANAALNARAAGVAARRFEGRLAVDFAGISFQNPVILAAGTAGYGRELAGTMDLEALGGLVTKAVSPDPRHGAPAPRVGEFPGGMINAIGLANPGLAAVRADHLPWCRDHLRRARTIVNVVGSTVDDFATVVAGLDDLAGHVAYELNVSCPNTRAGGVEFGADAATLAAVVRGARAATKRPLLVKLSPAITDLVAAARVAVDAGADALTLVNTMPGLAIDPEARRPVLGFGTGGVSGAALLPIGVRATWLVHRALPALPILGVGGVARATDAVQYLLAGATLVGIGTAAMQDPRRPGQVVAELEAWLAAHRVSQVSELRGALEWPG
ncbi:MAG: dihydroorotate dehydrogenase [Gemmatimonadetes bacterium]|nr:dihydroorotate dehydrogenase [Gemmatimonadota bacterium]